MNDESSDKKNESKSLTGDITPMELVIIAIIAILPGSQTVIMPIALYTGAMFLLSKGLLSVYKKVKKEEATRTPYFFFNISNLVFVLVLAGICVWELTTPGGDLNGILTAIIVAFVLPVNLALFIASAWMQRSKKLRKPLIVVISFALVILVEIIIASIIE